MIEYGTEAEHLSEIYDDSFPFDFEPYTKYERAEYVEAKNCRFGKGDVGKYVVVQTPRRNKSVVKMLYLTDRNLTKRFWWSPDAVYAMVFENKDSAMHQAMRYRYNKARVLQIKPYMADADGFEKEYL